MASMPDAWRIDRAKWSSTSFSGKGAAAAGGRWNPAGLRVVYASEHLATAALEKFLHLPKPIPPRMTFVQFAIEFNGVAVERPRLSDLPSNWRDEPVSAGSQKFGAAWYEAGRTAVLAVPSAIISEEVNYLLNPAHPDFTRISISKPAPFTFDPRLASLAPRHRGAAE
jgi:RES domain-containing protein